MRPLVGPIFERPHRPQALKIDPDTDWLRRAHGISYARTGSALRIRHLLSLLSDRQALRASGQRVDQVTGGRSKFSISIPLVAERAGVPGVHAFSI